MRARNIFFAFTLVPVAGCGNIGPSSDGSSTQLIIGDAVACPKNLKIFVDGAVWNHPKSTPYAIEPGVHIISCGPAKSVEITQRTTYRFDTWE